ncbi:hypothetical protein A3Q56_01418 [Intoshia linei]|uniref:RRM domain-containing protein n=1 Tax=Intoshia linei TaxID=1819745 RepID=A0A177B9B0_9BILA|nr:hypothetical protein A3Q56_01418 [Intoshia linei]
MSMNYLTKVRKIQQMNDIELESNLVGSKSSWHQTYKESNWIYIGALPYELSEGDIMCIFSQ